MSLRAETWLILRNDLRLLWRDVRTSRLRVFSSLILLGILLLVFQAGMILVCVAMGRPPPLTVEAIIWFFAGFVMLGSAMNHAVTVLFERADFDLLLSSPVSPAAILLARLSGMSAAAALSVALFLFPMLDGAAIGISPRYLWGYAVWAIVATTVACGGVWLTLILVRWLGVRRARVWAQVIAALLGATIYIIFQLQNLMTPEVRQATAGSLRRFFTHPAVTIIPRAARGEALPLLYLFALAITSALATTRLLGRVFVTGIQEAGVVRIRSSRIRAYHFVEGLIWATFRKDVRLIMRDPLLLSRVLPSVFYLMPVLFPIHQFGHVAAGGLLAPFIVIAAIMLSGQLTAVAAAGEEGWDLIRLSPASTVTLRLAKIAAGMALPMVLALLIAVIIALLGRPALALFALAIAFLGAVGSCWVEVALMHPTPRNDLIRRTAGNRRPFSVARTLGAIAFMGIGTAGAALAANSLWWWAWLAFGIVAIAFIACLTLVEMRDIEFEAPVERRKNHAPAAV